MTDNTQVKKPTVGGNPTAGQQCTDIATVPNQDDADKAFKTLQARFVLVGHTFHRMTGNHGEDDYLAIRWGMIRHIATLAEAHQFLIQIGGKHE